MQGRNFTLLAGASILTIAAVGVADAQTLNSGASQPTSELEEVVVTARRKAESLQNIPEMVNVVSGDAIDKMNILKFEDISEMVPGISMSSGTTGYSSDVTMRGVSYNLNSQASTTVGFYMNDTPVDANFLYQSLFDVDQIEALRGPQGTLRGIPAPSGALTIRTHKPDLYDYGGTLSVTGSDLGSANAQGAINLPIIEGKLAVRIAGVTDNSDFDGVKSIHNTADPYSKTQGIRTSIGFAPTDSIEGLITYQHLRRELQTYNQVVGTGAGYNGPPISAGQRLAVETIPNDVTTIYDAITGNLAWHVADHKLSYDFSYNENSVKSLGSLDAGDAFPLSGVQLAKPTVDHQFEQTHEVRLASEGERNLIDYTVGAFYKHSHVGVFVHQPTYFLPGTFTATGSPNLYNVDVSHALYANIGVPAKTDQISGYGGVTVHIDPDTELSGAVRAIEEIDKSITRVDVINSRGGFITTAVNSFTKRSEYPPIIYNIALNHKFDSDIMVYATTGTSWRAGPNQGVQVSNADKNPLVNALVQLKDEKSTSYEVGAKTRFLEKRGYFNLALYHQHYDSLIFPLSQVPYWGGTSVGNDSVQILSGSTNANVNVDGIDLDSGFKVSPHWTVHGSLSLSQALVDNQNIPCNPTPGQIPPLNSAKPIYFCPSNASAGIAPLWNSSLSTEYWHPITDDIDGYIRGIYTFYPANHNIDPGVFNAKSYGLLNVFIGTRLDEAAWDISLFAKNLLNQTTQLSMGPTQQQLTTSGVPNLPVTGYYGSTEGSTIVTPRREFGITVRYGFGSL